MARNPSATNIGSTFTELTNKIKTLNKEISSAERNAKQFDEALKLDPKNVVVAENKYQELSVAVTKATERLEAAKQKKQELDKAYADKSSDTYKNALARVTEEIKKYTAQLERLKVKQKDANEAFEQSKVSVEEEAKALEKAKTKKEAFTFATKNLKIAIVALVAGVVKLTQEMANLGKELVSNAKKYDTTVEKLQEQSYVFYALTGNANAYTSALQAMNSVMAQILSGRGISQLKILSKIGISKSDLAGKSTAEQYEVVFEALRNTEDAALATAVAVKLFGDAGAYVAEIAQTSADEYEKYLQKFRETAHISEESAKKLAELSNDLELLKYSFRSAGAEIIVTLAPAIEGLLKMVLGLAKGVAGVYNTFGEFGGVLITVSSIVLIKTIPALISLMIKTKLETSLTWGQVAAKTALIGVCTLGVGAIIGLSAAIAASAATTAIATNSTDEYTKSLNAATGAAEEFSKVATRLNTDLSVSSENIERRSSSYNADITFIVEAKGDTQISGETAKDLGEIIIDQVNKALGGIVE